jgi:hypothetical protein
VRHDTPNDSPTMTTIAYIPHCLYHFHEDSAIKSLIGFSKEPEQLLVYRSEVEYEGPLPREEPQMNPHKIVQDPPCSWILHRLSLGMGKDRSLLLERLTDAVLWAA